MGHDGVVGAGGEAAVLVLHHRHRVHVAPADHCLGVRLRDAWFYRIKASFHGFLIHIFE